MTLAQIVEQTKTSTLEWLKTKGLSAFAWQSDYEALSTGAGDLERTIGYIQAQEEHHRKTSFQ